MVGEPHTLTIKIGPPDTTGLYPAVLRRHCLADTLNSRRGLREPMPHSLRLIPICRPSPIGLPAPRRRRVLLRNMGRLVLGPILLGGQLRPEVYTEPHGPLLATIPPRKELHLPHLRNRLLKLNPHREPLIRPPRVNLVRRAVRRIVPPLPRLLLSIDDARRVTALQPPEAIAPRESRGNHRYTPLFPTPHDILVVLVLDFQLIQVHILPVILRHRNLADILWRQIILLQKRRVYVFVTRLPRALPLDMHILPTLTLSVPNIERLVMVLLEEDGFAFVERLTLIEGGLNDELRLLVLTQMVQRHENVVI